MLKPPSDLRLFSSLLAIVEALRGPEGCPWDKEQTGRSLAPFAIEEAHELAEAMESGNQADQIEELGDLLLQVALQAEVARGEGRFSMDDVLLSINEKMVRRHPHVFSEQPTNASSTTTREVLTNWAQIKAQEKAAKGLSGQQAPEDFAIPLALPALQRAQKIGQKTKQIKFDWEDVSGVLEKLDEEILELKEACSLGSHHEQEHELGDVLFCLAQLGRHLNLETEQALRSANARFSKRYFLMLKIISEAGLEPQKLSASDKEAYWQQAKDRLKDQE